MIALRLPVRSEESYTCRNSSSVSTRTLPLHRLLEIHFACSKPHIVPFLSHCCHSYKTWMEHSCCDCVVFSVMNCSRKCAFQISPLNSGEFWISRYMAVLGLSTVDESGRNEMRSITVEVSWIGRHQRKAARSYAHLARLIILLEIGFQPALYVVRV